MAFEATESAKNAAYGKGYRDAQRGVFRPPKGDYVVDFVFGALDKLAGTPSSREMAEAVGAAYRDGHAAGSRK